MGQSTQVPVYQTPQPTAEETQLAQQSQMADVRSTMDDTRMDTARLMAVYGTRLAMGGTASGSPLLNAPAAR